MKWFRNNAEVLTGYLLGLLMIGFGLFIFFNADEIINFKEIAINKLHMSQLSDFINLYSYAFIELLSHYIKAWPYLYSLVFILYGLGLFYISHILKKTTSHDTSISIFYLLTAVFLFMLTALFMFKVYDSYALFYFAAFLLLIFYALNRHNLNSEFRKMHYLILILIFGLAYIVTQNHVYDRLVKESVTPLDLMALNFFFILLSGMGLLALGNHVFLHRAKKVSAADHSLSRANRRKRDRKFSRLINHQTNDAFAQISKQSMKIDERLMLAWNQFTRGIRNWIDLQDEDIPGWMRKPKWFSFFQVEILFGLLMLLLTLIELNNRNVLFNVTKFNVVKMQYFYEWLSLFILLLTVICYLFFTVMIRVRNRGYFGQLFTISILFIEIMTSFYLLLFKGVSVALFIPPVIVLLVILVTPLFVNHLRKNY
ncbi:lipoteichoic acid stability factor AuxA [Macrococcus carouselicus]|uniref:Uncharacterized protein n=1 Tax=Macrococcus carouselicus TaxID=69969 RepID=A0A9Q8FRA4_9STAP|nr:hypothetical protein [Macrococcus carouselicus]TDM03874.1 hypothetical protein ERX40_01545 [Macrococcus carouselicus]